MLTFKNKILFVGYGAVAECTLPILFKHLKVPAKNVTIMDFEDRSKKLRQWTAKGVHFVRDRVTESNMTTLLAKHVGPGDILIDLAWNIDACEILQWCHDNGVRYINTSTELWDPYSSGPNAHPTTKTLYYRHMNLRRMLKKWKTKGPTAVIEHGANPGLISHFVKQGLIDIGTKLIKDKKAKGARAKKITQYIN
ncbi:MAG: hss, partial [Lacunisphaera sp.]|nr:hss [Lacunisphaera sp.]